MAPYKKEYGGKTSVTYLPRRRRSRRSPCRWSSGCRAAPTRRRRLGCGFHWKGGGHQGVLTTARESATVQSTVGEAQVVAKHGTATDGGTIALGYLEFRVLGLHHAEDFDRPRHRLRQIRQILVRQDNHAAIGHLGPSGHVRIQHLNRLSLAKRRLRILKPSLT